MNNILSFLSLKCFKYKMDIETYKQVKSTCHMIGPVDLYCLYLVSCTTTPLDYKTFYSIAKQELFYDKFVCEHGVEYIYYVDFASDFEQVNKNLINYYYTKCSKLLNDCLDVVPAIGNTNSIDFALDVARDTRRK